MALKNLKEYKRRRFESGDYGDCWFEIINVDKKQPSKKLCAIKTILQIASPVFNEMLNSSDENSESTIVLKNMDEKVFQKFLDFIQWEEIALDGIEEAFSLIELSRKYKIPDLEDICVKFLENKCDSTNACIVFEKATALGLNGLVETALIFIKMHTTEVFASPALLETKIDTLVTILDKDALSIDSELEVFEMVSRYADHNGFTINPTGLGDIFTNENDKKLSEMIKKIRFMAMTPSEFALKPMVSNLLTSDQKVAIIGKLLLRSEPTHAFPLGFTVKPQRIHFLKSFHTTQEEDDENNVNCHLCKQDVNQMTFNGRHRSLIKGTKKGHESSTDKPPKTPPITPTKFVFQSSFEFLKSDQKGIPSFASNSSESPKSNANLFSFLKTANELANSLSDAKEKSPNTFSFEPKNNTPK